MKIKLLYLLYYQYYRAFKIYSKFKKSISDKDIKDYSAYIVSVFSFFPLLGLLILTIVKLNPTVFEGLNASPWFYPCLGLFTLVYSFYIKKNLESRHEAILNMFKEETLNQKVIRGWLLILFMILSVAVLLYSISIARNIMLGVSG